MDTTAATVESNLDNKFNKFKGVLPHLAAPEELCNQVWSWSDQLHHQLQGQQLRQLLPLS